MRVAFYPEEDALYVRLTEEPFAYGRELDAKRHVTYSADGEIIGIEFLNVSEGVDLDDIPEQARDTITLHLKERNVKVYA